MPACTNQVSLQGRQLGLQALEACFSTKQTRKGQGIYKEIKDLKVPHEPNPMVVVLRVVAHVAIAEAHVPTAVGRVL